MKAKWPYLFVTEASHLVHKLLLDHEGSQVGCVAGQEDDGEEGPHGHHDLAGGPFRILDRHGVVEHQAPEEPNSFSNCKRRPMGCCKWQEGHSQRVLQTHTWEHALAPATLKAVRRQVYLITVPGPQPQVLFSLKISVLPTFLYCWLFATFLKRKGKKGRQTEEGREVEEGEKKEGKKKERKEGRRKGRKKFTKEGGKNEGIEGGRKERRKRKWLWKFRLELEVVLWPVLNVDLIWLPFGGYTDGLTKKTCAYGLIRYACVVILYKNHAIQRDWCLIF